MPRNNHSNYRTRMAIFVTYVLHVRRSLLSIYDSYVSFITVMFHTGYTYFTDSFVFHCVLLLYIRIT